MKKLDIPVAKSRAEFHRNYELHTLAQEIGERWLRRWGFEVERFGEDARYRRVWEAGADKPDAIILHRGVPVALVDWKAKATAHWWMNRRAYQSYLRWEQKRALPAFVVFALFDRAKRKLLTIRFVPLAGAPVVSRRRKTWDRNVVVEIPDDALLPFRRDHFTRSVLVLSRSSRKR